MGQGKMNYNHIYGRGMNMLTGCTNGKVDDKFKLEYEINRKFIRAQQDMISLPKVYNFPTSHTIDTIT